jgi:hypothetical protein
VPLVLPLLATLTLPLQLTLTHTLPLRLILTLKYLGVVDDAKSWRIGHEDGDGHGDEGERMWDRV